MDPRPAPPTTGRWAVLAGCVLLLVLLPPRQRVTVGLVMLAVWAWRRVGPSLHGLVQNTLNGVAGVIVFLLIGAGILLAVVLAGILLALLGHALGL